MNIVTGSKHLCADTAIALDVEGREHLVIVAKATWSIPEPGGRPRPLAPQALTQSDVFLGEPGTSPMLYGADFARFKPRCDVLFNARAYAPGGEPVPEVLAAWQVGALRKGVNVLGHRRWQRTLGLFFPTRPEPFSCQPLHYGLAFGGTFLNPEDQDRPALTCYPENPVGIGWAGAALERTGA